MVSYKLLSVYQILLYPCARTNYDYFTRIGGAVFREIPAPFDTARMFPTIYVKVRPKYVKKTAKIGGGRVLLVVTTCCHQDGPDNAVRPTFHTLVIQVIFRIYLII